MSEPSLKPGLWVKAQLRLCDLRMLRAYVAKSGAHDFGTILIKLNMMDGRTQVFFQVRGIDGQRSWMRGTSADFVDEVEADAYICRELKRDPDLWVIEIEDPKGKYEFDGPIL